MGLKVNMTEMHEQINSMNAILSEKITNGLSLLQAITLFCEDTILGGCSYQSAKDYFREVHLPIVRGIIRANEEIIEANNEFLNRFHGQVDASPNAEIDTDRLDELTARSIEINQIFNDASIEMGGPTQDISGLGSELVNIQKMKQMIQSLYDFENGNLELYHNAKLLLDNVKRGLDFLNSGSWDVATNSFKSIKLDEESWASLLNKDWKIEKETSKVDIYVNQFGMSEDQAKALIDFEEKFSTYAKAQGWSQEKINQEFAKILASGQYGTTDDANQKLWEISADVYNRETLMNLLISMGYSYENANDFIDKSKELYSTENLKNDYVHLMGSLAVILNKSALSSITKLSSSRNIMHSYYKEAATYAGDIASGGVSLEDSRSDIDALVIGGYLEKNPSRDITSVINEYYLNIESGKSNRAEELLKYYGNGDVKLGYTILEKNISAGSKVPSGMVLILKNSNSNIEEDMQKFMDYFNKELNGNN
ncbi:T7SS effector LXG polymorphic toxin [Listeria swaminathanii]|uniref:T7SS effector LXG polymorphic toxin n=1 Tax=Listeria swaminathanii TaxID=2713501 RepID=A0ABU2ICY5_9LIST|nr:MULTISPECIES: T7SS effector LXG polymorphic toxin [Listeria]MBC2121668.1 hypothetical protein [Listeria marthii]MDT0016167.1 T7SS effector LXG polymorphic toxin [Listeria swaminathanii]MDT0021603.1 T7SS effector LXG polymorphic toxin [Listeria swaminathanii]MDT0032567.1 T7SS effector LXG polymorphic toxin [Listeria swaminathanii]MDT0051583.1 T7SS effector LXG polymorphic toxin [Listeria swaminathanii]